MAKADIPVKEQLADISDKLIQVDEDIAYSCHLLERIELILQEALFYCQKDQITVN